MDYISLARTYEELETTPSKLKKTEILSNLLKKVPSEQLEKVVLLMRGTVFPGYSQLDLGVADKMVIRTIMKATGFSESEVVEKFKTLGDLGKVAEECLKNKKQVTLAKKKLTIDLVFSDLQKLAEVVGSGSQDKKMGIIAEMIVSSTPMEARYIIRTVLGNLRTGASDGIVRDAIVQTFLQDEEKKEAKQAVEYALSIIADFGEVARIAKEDGMTGLKKAKIEIGKPIQVMLAEKGSSIDDVLKKYDNMVVEWKFDGMRTQIHKNGDKIWVYTRRLEDVTRQFPDIVEMIRKSVKAKECVIEGEALAINTKTNEPLPFQVLSQRIQRKYEIEKMVKEIPIQLNLFDAIYIDDENLVSKKFIERRKALEKNVKETEGLQIAKQIKTNDVKKVEEFYQEALSAKQEGIMLKVLDAPYNFGRHVDGWVKIKPIMETLDLVIVASTWGEGARANWLTSFTLACRDGEKLLECGNMSTGFTEEEFKNITEILKPMILEESGKEIKVKPNIVVEVEYQEIQKSSKYASGYALRFPSFKNIRPDKGLEDVDDIERVKKLYNSQGRAG